MTATPIARPTRDASTFEAMLAAAGRRQQAGQAREAAQQMVASAFIMPVLADLRESPFLSGPFAPGAAERRFGPLLDQHVADRITAGDRFPLIDQITEHLLSAKARSLGLTQTPHPESAHGHS
ncbi:MAG: hypothetical protein SYC29_04090 [Planctomycetota bacterium]|nr:hypothetical protein [Planctomycetota bacterium]